MTVVRDDPDRPDPAFAELYSKLGDAIDLEPWLGWCLDATQPVLYLGIGTGRLAAPLTRAGVRFTGVDAHPGMLDALGARGLDIDLVLSRIEDLDLGSRFDLVIAPSNILCTPARLRGAARHLREGGRVGFELMNPHWLFAGARPGVRVIELNRRRAWIEVDYPGGYRQQANFELVWPEEMEAWLAAARLNLGWMDGSGDDLDSSATFRILALTAHRS